MQLCKNSISYQKNYLTVGKTTSPLGDYKGNKMKVKIKTWEAMEKEYGKRSCSIKVQFSFTELMEKLMPKDRIIEVKQARIDKYTWDFGGKSYAISLDMIEEWIFGEEVKDTIQKIIEDL